MLGCQLQHLGGQSTIRSGPTRPALAPNLRYFVVGAYLILYQQTATGIQIVRVVRVVRGTRNMPELPLI